jgi:CHC2 zinc finger
MTPAQMRKAAAPEQAAFQDTNHTAKNTAPNGLKQFEQAFKRSYRPGQKSLDRGSLPTALQYITERGLLKGKQRGQWITICCPAHKAGAEVHPSMGVSVADGHFRCFACGAAGGDIVALHRLVTGLGFLDAVRDLGGRFHD